MSRRLAERYVLGDQLGVGGTSRVHAALDTRLGRQVAVKLLNSSVAATADPAGRERFLREGQTTAGFSHRHAVTVFDAGEDDGDLYIVMELVDGPSLAEHLVRTGPLPIDETVRIASQVLSALAAAHAAGLVHRDVKPANILIGADGEIKLADFGIAKRFDDLDASVTATGMVIGTPRYLAPEQALGGTPTPSSDVYSMGIVLFEMLTGRLPFEADSTMAAVVAQQSATAPDVRALRPDAPTALAAVVARALAAQPGERPATAAELLASLNAASSSAGAEPTQVMNSRVTDTRSGATQLFPSVPLNAGSHLPHASTGRTAALVFAILVVLLGIGVAAATLSADDAVDPLADQAVVTAPTEPAATGPSDTEPSTTEPLATQPPATQPLATQPPATEIVPGFPATNDLEVFLEQVERNPELLGESGEDLAERLRKVIEARGAKQRHEAEDLRNALDEWVNEGEVPPAIAEALDELLATLVEKE